MTTSEHGGNIYKYQNKMIDFSANINPLGMPKSVREALCSNIDAYENYPDPNNQELRHAISKSFSVNCETIVCGNGAADIIYKTVLALKPKRALVVSPTFSEYETALGLVDCRVKHYVLTEDTGFVPDNNILDDITSDLDIMFICNPNNPTGIAASYPLICSIAQKCGECGVVLMVDECFAEFAENTDSISILPYVSNFSNLIVLKAFTKIYAMAGIRLGFAICGSVSLAEKIAGTLQPWSVSTVASKCGVAALSETDFVEKTKGYIKAEREYLISKLTELNFKVYPSCANYILFKSHILLSGSLEAENILIRSCQNYYTLDSSYYRIAVRTHDENEYLIKSLKKITEENANG